MYNGPIIDCDVHHGTRSQADLLPYLPKGRQEYVMGRRPNPVPLYTSGVLQNPQGFTRRDATPPNGDPPGSDYETMKHQLLDPCHIERAVLTYENELFMTCWPNPYFAAEIVHAANDWTVDQWLPKDDRFCGSILISNHLPDEAAKEVRRLGHHPRMCQVVVSTNALGHALGHPLFHPIYEAAVEVGLPVAIHGASTMTGGIVSPVAHAYPNYYIEYHVLSPQGPMTHLTSLIVNGVFEKYPSLKILILEAGVGWLPPFLWRFDSEYKALRREVPWVKRLPSEYFRDHIRLTTQPFELSPKREHMIELLSFIDAQDLLLFSTDYPHWDSDEVAFITKRLPESWLPKIMWENAVEAYGNRLRLGAQSDVGG
jgi:predicted TIM-barrel fold metal-dependent hydrolase